MNTMKIKLINKNGHTQTVSDDGANCTLLYTKEYEQGDKIFLDIQTVPCFLVVQFEDSLPSQLIYVTKPEIIYQIPFDSDRIVFSPKAFSGSRHVIRARFANEDEIKSRQNLALNVYDRHGENGYFPHSSANVETRGEAVFASYNAIDGVFENASHGEWPYQSWGINRNPNAAITVDFGRETVIDEIRITLRADFPHDSYWTSGKITFSDGSSETLTFAKVKEPQCFNITARTTNWIKLDSLIKADDNSPFPALTQIEAYGNFYN